MMRLGLLKLLLFLNGFFAKCAKLCEALFRGIVRERDCSKLSAKCWDETEWIQQEEHTFSGLFTWEEEHILPFVKKASKVLIIGCGTGRDVFEFANWCPEVVGIDSSANAIFAANRLKKDRFKNVEFHLCDVLDEPIPGKGYDLVIFSWFTYCFLPSLQMRKALLKNLKGKVTSDAVILVSRKHLPPTKYDGLMRKVIEKTQEIIANPEPMHPDDVLTVQGEKGSVYFFKNFKQAELVSEFLDEGYDFISEKQVAGDLHLTTFTDLSR